MGITIRSASLPDSTILSNDFIDKIMPSANGEFVKIYIYLLRCFAANISVSICGIADLFEHTEKDVMRALKYWEKNSLLAIEYDEQKKVCGIELIGGTGTSSGITANTVEASSNSMGVEKVEASTNTQATQALNSSTVKASKNEYATKEYSSKEYTLDEIQEFQKNEAISELFFIIETYMKHPLSSNDTNTILFWYAELGFSAELIEYLVEYCITKGHSSIRYMNKVAIAWKEQGIESVSAAKGNAQTHSKAYYAVMKAFGIKGRDLVETEMNYLNKWSKDYAFDLELIQEACKRTMTSIHQPSFEYADKILTSWHTSKVHTLKDIEKMDASYAENKRIKPNVEEKASSKNRFNNFNQREYDIDQLEKLLLSTSIH